MILRIVLSDDDIAVTGFSLTCANVTEAIHLHEAVETDTDAAKDSARAIVFRGLPEAQPVVRHDDAGDALPEDSGDCLPLKRDRQCFRCVWPDRILVARKHARGHYATAVRCGARVSRAREYGAVSSSEGVPATMAASNSPVTGASPIPAPSWPVACHSPGRR